MSFTAYLASLLLKSPYYIRAKEASELINMLCRWYAELFIIFEQFLQ